MAATNGKTKAVPTVQEVCIDLPGETVQCWRSSDNIKVILRKHRDVIFELKLGQGKKYTIESSESDFYNADAKKLIPGKGRQCVFFNDGDRLHIWIARDFKGFLLLKSEGRLMLKIEPAKLDAQQYNEDPKTKPDPIVIAIGGSAYLPRVPAEKIAQQINRPQDGGLYMSTPPMAAPVDEDCALVCVVDGDLKGIPADVWGKLKNGGGQSGLVDLDPNNVATRNWLLGQLAGSTAYVRDNWDWLRASVDGKTHAGFKLVKAKIHYVRGKARYYFSGYSKYNAVFGRGGFGSGQDRIMSIFGGTGKASSVMTATAKGVAGTFKGNALVSFIFGSATALAEWQADVSKDGYDLAASLITSAVKSIVAAAIAAAIVACVVFLLMFVLQVGVSVLAVGALAIGAGVIGGYVVDAADKKLGRMVAGDANQDGLSAVLAERMRQSVMYHSGFLKKKLFWDYEESVF